MVESFDWQPDDFFLTLHLSADIAEFAGDPATFTVATPIGTQAAVSVARLSTATLLVAFNEFGAAPTSWLCTAPDDVVFLNGRPWSAPFAGDIDTPPGHVFTGAEYNAGTDRLEVTFDGNVVGFTGVASSWDIFVDVDNFSGIENDGATGATLRTEFATPPDTPTSWACNDHNGVTFEDGGHWYPPYTGSLAPPAPLAASRAGPENLNTTPVKPKTPKGKKTPSGRSTARLTRRPPPGKL